MRRLLYSVTVQADGAMHTFGPDDEVPAWAVALINPARFAAADDDGDTPASPRAPRKAKAKAVAAVEAEAEAESGGGDAGDSPIPPRTGTGAGKAAWSEYAETLGVTVDAEATRDDIITAIEAAGHPVDRPAAD